MRRISLALIFFLSLWAWAQTIEDFSVALKLGTDASLEVTEKISVYFNFPRHGIIWEIPVSYRLPTGERYRIRVELLEVFQDGEVAPHRTYQEDGHLVVKIGDPKITVQGFVPYTLRYRVLRALVGYEKEVELYWNAVGTEWTMPIRRAQVEILLPPEVPQESVRFVGYQGPYGSTTPFMLSWQEGRLFGETADLSPGQGVAVAVRVPKDFLTLPDLGQRLLWFLQDNIYAAIPLLVLLGMVVIWWRWGRDPELGTVAPEFTPPPGLGPAEAGALVDDRFDPRDFTAGLLSLATKGWLKIREVEKDFQLVPQEGGAKLTPFEEALRETLLTSKKEGPKFSDLKYHVYREIPGLGARLFTYLVDQGFYPGNPENVRSLWRVLGVGGVVLGVGLLFLWANVYLAVSVSLAGLTVFLFAPYMPRKTPRGMAILRQVLGLEEYIRRAEVDRLEFAAKEKHFEELLPYAVAFNLSDVWAEKFAGLLREPPNWYEPRGPWVPLAFPARLLLFQRLGQTAALAAPRMASGRGGWSGGSGFGGRGFSGGGLGGGGGRAW